ncbi:MAG: LemA family protein [Alphaproteobacteria bacterium]|nr:LemA family protein [Alphaproteobacteria bacterium]
MSTTAWVWVGLAIIAGLIIILYNRLVALRQAWRGAYADIDVQLKQRADLIPNLVETVKGYAAHESTVLQNVVAARSAALNAGTPAARGAAEGALTGALGQLFAVAESYPDLKANENFRQLQAELGDIENKIAAARRFLNNAVAEYNTAIEQFPAVLVARPFGFAPAEMFALDGAERAAASQPPKVSFGGH